MLISLTKKIFLCSQSLSFYCIFLEGAEREDGKGRSWKRKMLRSIH